MGEERRRCPAEAGGEAGRRGRARTFPKRKTVGRLAHPKADVARRIAATVRIDRQEDGGSGTETLIPRARRQGPVPQGMQRLQALERPWPTHRTDRSRRPVRMRARGRRCGRFGCNARAAVDAGTHPLVARAVTNQGDAGSGRP